MPAPKDDDVRVLGRAQARGQASHLMPPPPSAARLARAICRRLMRRYAYRQSDMHAFYSCRQARAATPPAARYGQRLSDEALLRARATHDVPTPRRAARRHEGHAQPFYAADARTPYIMYIEFSFPFCTFVFKISAPHNTMFMTFSMYQDDLLR